MKLELKHLAGYLPYNLKGLIKNTSDTFVELSTYISNKEFKWTIDMFLGDSNVKPILRPLSDITKEIEVKGEKFIPINKINTLNICDRDIDEHLSFCGGGSWEGGYEDGIDSFQFYLIFQKLLEWNFDIYGLIEKGLAIDINTLEK